MTITRPNRTVYKRIQFCKGFVSFGVHFLDDNLPTKVHAGKAMLFLFLKKY